MCKRYRLIAISCLAGLLLAALPAAGAEMVRLTKERYIDKCRGAWAGQMIGVCYGGPYEFRSNGQPITTELKPWKIKRVEGSITQDDCYVEMTFLQALEQHGLDITFEQAGKVFGDSQYKLWHANRYGRENIRRGIMPPKSGHPDYNRHADDIDFQIEADLLGIICPGMPGESNRLCDIFGHIMNYGDGVYGGMFVAGMYAAAYIEDNDVQKVIREGLACIPEKSLYHQCISDVIRWHKEHPDDWLAAWKKIEEKWQDDVDCYRGAAFNIDAKLNGAYIVMGMLYGNGDPLRTMEISTRCGQDADCNPSNAMGVLGCMKGYKALGEPLTGGIPAIEDKNFSFTNYSFKTLPGACQLMTEKIIQRAGGRVEGDVYLIPLQKPIAPEKLEQWENQERDLTVALPKAVVDMWNPAFEAIACGHNMEPGIEPNWGGRTNVLMIHPVSEIEPATLRARIDVPAGANPKLSLDVASHKSGNFLLKVLVNGQTVIDKLIDTQGKFVTETADLSAHAGKTVKLQIEAHSNDWSTEAAYLSRFEVK